MCRCFLLEICVDRKDLLYVCVYKNCKCFVIGRSSSSLASVWRGCTSASGGGMDLLTHEHRWRRSVLSHHLRAIVGRCYCCDRHWEPIHEAVCSLSSHRRIDEQTGCGGM
jgi:hypothetical protein